MSRYAMNRKVNPYSTHGFSFGASEKNQYVLDVSCNEGYICRSFNHSIYRIIFMELILILIQ